MALGLHFGKPRCICGTHYEISFTQLPKSARQDHKCNVSATFADRIQVPD